MQDFYFFQKPAQYVGGDKIYSNSIYNSKLRPSSHGGQLKFSLLQQYYAGVETQAGSIIVGQASGTIIAIQPIELASSDPQSKDVTDIVGMELDPLGLTEPRSAKPEEKVTDGSFRIITPSFNPDTQKYNAGLGVTLEDGSYSLSNFINAEPSKNIDCQPIVIFYIQTGGYVQGDVINFTSSSVGAAVCDATNGTTTFNVSYEKDGSWVVNGVPYHGLTQSI
jgi:hypothetical protein